MSSTPGGRQAPFAFKDGAANAVFKSLPPGLETAPDVLNDFLDPPADMDEWFLHRAWDATSAALDADNGVSDGHYDNIEGFYNVAEAGLLAWTQQRDPNTNTAGWGTMTSAMRAEGATAYYKGILPLVKEATQLTPDDASTEVFIKSFCDVLWEYAASMGLEMEASTRTQPIEDIRESVDRGIAHPWAPAMTPTNIDTDEWIGTHRDPQSSGPPGIWAPPDDPNNPDDPSFDPGENGEGNGSGG
jgi:hypothetical protein